MEFYNLYDKICGSWSLSLSLLLVSFCLFIFHFFLEYMYMYIYTLSSAASSHGSVNLSSFQSRIYVNRAAGRSLNNYFNLTSRLHLKTASFQRERISCQATLMGVKVSCRFLDFYIPFYLLFFSFNKRFIDNRGSTSSLTSGKGVVESATNSLTRSRQASTHNLEKSIVSDIISNNLLLKILSYS